MSLFPGVNRGHGFTIGMSVAALGWPYLDDETDMEQLSYEWKRQP